jgi:hypothetical protein
LSGIKFLSTVKIQKNFEALKFENFKMADIFENTILCKNCNIKMKQAKLIRNGFEMRALLCERCGNKIIHPDDEVEYGKFLGLRGKIFKVKMRIVGNSYAVSIPKEIVEFMHDQEKLMDDIVRVAFNDAKKLSLMFGEGKEVEEEK